MKRCAICAQLEGHHQHDLLHEILGGPYRRRVLLENDSVAVLPSVGPLKVGHVLLVPQKHRTRMADVALLETFMTQVLGTLEQQFAAPVHRFEHGASRDGAAVPCTVSHAHLHLLPTNVRINLDQSPYVWDKASENTWPKLVGDGEYLYYRSPEGTVWVARTRGKSFKSQHLRRLFAGSLGVADEWNWREYPREDVIRETLERFV